MIITLDKTSRFKREWDLMLRRGKDAKKFKLIIELLLDNADKGISPHALLPAKYQLHKISGKFKGRFECHIDPDWLLIFYLDKKVLRLERTGTHSDIFN